MATIHDPIIFDYVAVGGYVGNLNALATTEQIYLNSIGYQGDDPDPQTALVGFNQFAFLNPALVTTEERAVEVGISNAGSISFTSIRTFLHFDASSIVNNLTEGELFTEAELRLQNFPGGTAAVNFRIFRSTAWEAGLSNNPPVSDFRQADFSTAYSSEIFFSNYDTDSVYKIPLNENFLSELNSSGGKVQLAIVDTITAGHIIGNSIDSVSIRNTGFNFTGSPLTTTPPQLILTSGFAYKNPYKGVVNQIQLSTKAKSFSDMVRDYENLKHRYS